MDTHKLPNATILSDLAEDGKYGHTNGSYIELLRWVLQAKSELDYFRELSDKLYLAKSLKEVKALLL